MEWIKCSDQAPPPDRHLLLAWNLDPDTEYDYGFGTPGEYDHTLECIRQGCVTHWMLLPEPPKTFEQVIREHRENHFLNPKP